ncbi:hypothetical protein [Paenibacillus aquistagni]|uniref:hypothetical protein n=1 Tax=Paenibacillus aquistagni TaxID=1852522 RepID=UPI000B50E679|nr:hypothetical protein [Paenibacillus aquistagni]
MIEDKVFSAVFPVLIVLIVLAVIYLRVVHKKISKTVFKLIGILSIASISLIVLFAFLYLVIFMIDFNHEIKTNDNVIVELIELKYFKGIDLSLYEEIKYLVFVDLLSFSASIFFHSPTNISLVGTGQVIVIIEGYIGIITMMSTLILIIKKNNEENAGAELLQIYLNRGWNILRTRSSELSKEYISIELISPKRELKSVIVKRTRYTADLIDQFKVNWRHEDVISIPLFIRSIQELLYKEDSSLANESIVLYARKDTMDLEYYKQVHIFLNKISNSNFYYESENLSTDINYMISSIEKEIAKLELSDEVTKNEE